MVFLVSVLFMFVLGTNNILLWWSVFVFMDLVFIFLCKSVDNYSIIINYFIIQERLALMFLIVNSLMIQFFIVITKMGIAPFHY